MTRRVFYLKSEQIRRRAQEAIWDAPDNWKVTLAPETRTLEENSLLHVLIDEISKKVEWAGKKREPETWKRLLVAAWCRVHGESVEILPALDGHGVDIVYRKTSKLSRKECAELIEFVFAWGAMNDIQFPDPKAI